MNNDQLETAHKVSAGVGYVFVTFGAIMLLAMLGCIGYIAYLVMQW